MQNRINQTEKLINDISGLLMVVTVFLAEKELPIFKKEKGILYKNMIQKFSALEKNNS